MKNKLIIVIPHYNNPKGLLETINSINEGFKIDLIIIDDGSKLKPDTSHILTAYKLGKVVCINIVKNQGITYCLNKGLEYIRGKKYKYFGRLDAGDICYKDKFKKQIDFLEKNPEVKLVGTWARVVDQNRNFLYNIKHPTSHNDIQKKMYINSMFVHPTIVVNTSILNTVKGYPKKYKYTAQDYAFFFHVIKHFKVANVPEILLDYIDDKNSISSVKRKQQVKNRIKIILENFKFGFYPIYGLIRSIILYPLSRNIITRIKKLLNYE